MIVVSNSSPLITLARIGHFNLPQLLFGKIHIASEVYNEVVVVGEGRPASVAVKSADWIDIHPPMLKTALNPWQVKYRLGDGELGTILLARSISADLALIDERLARKLAHSLSIEVIGCVGLLEIGYRRGVVNNLRQSYQAMLHHGTHIDLRILNHSLAAFHLPPL